MPFSISIAEFTEERMVDGEDCSIGASGRARKPCWPGHAKAVARDSRSVITKAIAYCF